MTNPKFLELANRLGNEELPRENAKTKLSQIAEALELQGYIYIPSINLFVAKEKILHNNNWDNTHKELQKQNQRMLTIPQFVSFINYLKSVPSYHTILDEILTVRDPWRSEWLDAYFEKRKDGFYVLTENKTKPEKLEDYLAKDKTPGIDLEDWLKNPTSQGLPRKNCKAGNLYYWHPVEGKVARFVAYSVRAILICVGDPQGSNSVLGVRPCVAPR